MRASSVVSNKQMFNSFQNEVHLKLQGANTTSNQRNNAICSTVLNNSSLYQNRR